MINYKEVERMLYSINTIRAAVIDIQIEIDNVENEYQGLIGRGENEIKPTTPTNMCASTVESEVVNKDTRVQKLKRLKRTKELQVERVENMITTLKDEEKKILEHIYFKGYSLEQTGVLLNLSYPTVRSKRRLIISSLVTFLNATK